MAAEDYIPDWDYENDEGDPTEYYADDFDVVRWTEKAMMFDIEGYQFWLPRSVFTMQCETTSKREDFRVLIPAKWFVERYHLGSDNPKWKVRDGY